MPVELTDEVGLIDEEALLASLPDKEWRHRFELSIERCGFVARERPTGTPLY